MLPLFQQIPLIQEGASMSRNAFNAMLTYFNSKQDGGRKRAFKKTNELSNVVTVQHDFFKNFGLIQGSYSVMVTIKDANNELVGNYNYQETSGDVLTITFQDNTYRLTGEIVVDSISF